MLSDELTYQIQEELPFAPTAQQAKTIRVFAEFMTDRDPHAVMILRGSAGTGKTTLAGSIVRTMVRLQQKVMLLAPTGRAAKVFSLNSNHVAFTIHRKIYRQKSLLGKFSLNDNMHHDMLFLVDESSMIANEGSPDAVFGSGYLLDDLVQYVYSGRNCRMVLIGDQAQLPPVGEVRSPALQAGVLSAYGLKVYEYTLTEVLRQAQDSGILFNANQIRMIGDGLLPKIRFKGFADIRVVRGDELIETLSDSYSQVGIDETMVVTRSNKRANIYNQGIRNMVLDREEELSSGDMLMIVKNNYYWADLSPKLGDDRGLNNHGSSNPRPSNLGGSYIANGDRALVRRVRHSRELFGFRFADLLLQFPDYDDTELTATVIIDSLHTEAPALTREQHERLFNAVMEDYDYIPQKAERIKKLKSDPYYNALQIKYAYAVTCHKAQGGQWAHVYIDQGYMTDDMLTPDYIHWLYTAFTRATEQLYLVNWPEKQQQ